MSRAVRLLSQLSLAVTSTSTSRLPKRDVRCLSCWISLAGIDWLLRTMADRV